jgi:hypothetical protein
MQSSFDYSSKVTLETHPLSFLADVPKGSHIVLFHEEDRNGEALEFWYLLHGLVKGEGGVYLTLDDPRNVKNRMKERGIDVEYYEGERGLLHIIRFKDPNKHPLGFEYGMREMYHDALNGVKRPCRVVGASVPEIETEEQIRLNLEVESGARAGFQKKAGKESVYSVFDDFQGSVLCHYSISGNFTEAQRGWMVQNQRYHDEAILAPKSRKTAFMSRGGIE